MLNGIHAYKNILVLSYSASVQMIINAEPCANDDLLSTVFKLNHKINNHELNQIK